MRRVGVFLVAAAFSWVANANNGTHGTCFPKNNLRIPDNQFVSSNVSEEAFHQILDDIETVYRPVIAANGKELVVRRLWETDTVNASAQQIGNQWILNMYGGLARHEKITEDGFALVACHELGHHLGGAPKKGVRWASNEGQSDYFATLKCFRKIYGNADNTSYLESAAKKNKAVYSFCTKNYDSQEEQAFCARSVAAGKALGSLLATLSKQELPKVATPDQTVATRTIDSHPKAQCRLDTYVAGTLCDADVDSELSNIDPNIGTCSRKFGDTIGVRPLCWYKPETDLHLAGH